MCLQYVLELSHLTVFVGYICCQLDIHAQLLNAVAIVLFQHACWSSLRLHIPASVASAPASGNAVAGPGGKAPATVRCNRRTRLEQRRREQASAVAMGYARMAFLGLKALQDMAAQPAVSRNATMMRPIYSIYHACFIYR
jgi:hypothetical protein